MTCQGRTGGRTSHSSWETALAHFRALQNQAVQGQTAVGTVWDSPSALWDKVFIPQPLVLVLMARLGLGSVRSGRELTPRKGDTQP